MATKTVLKEHPVISLAEVRDLTGLSFNASSAGVKSLQDLGIARELTGQQRDRVYGYDAYIQILNEGSEPL